MTERTYAIAEIQDALTDRVMGHTWFEGARVDELNDRPTRMREAIIKAIEGTTEQTEPSDREVLQEVDRLVAEKFAPTTAPFTELIRRSLGVKRGNYLTWDEAMVEIDTEFAND